MRACSASNFKVGTQGAGDYFAWYRKKHRYYVHALLLVIRSCARLPSKWSESCRCPQPERSSFCLAREKKSLRSHHRNHSEQLQERKKHFQVTPFLRYIYRPVHCPNICTGDITLQLFLPLPDTSHYSSCTINNTTE